jgi:hypothetical protein
MNATAKPMPHPSEHGIREQLEILWRYQSINEILDPRFIRSHALSVVQLSDELEMTRRRTPLEEYNLA